MMTIKAFANRIGLKSSNEWVDENPNMADMPQGSSHYKVQLRAGGRQLTTFFSMGRAHSSEPEAVEVLDCLISDATSVDGNSFESWCADMGFNSDSRKAEKIYKACLRINDRLHQFLGDAFQTAVDAERL